VGGWFGRLAHEGAVYSFVSIGITPGLLSLF
jgi:hypothetical protein